MRVPRHAGRHTELSARLHALMERAVALYDARRYRDALALCDEIERLDSSAALPEIMRSECRRALLKRRARLAAAAVAVGVLCAGAAFVYRQLARIRPEPGEGTYELAELEEQRFAFASGLHTERKLEFTWSLLDLAGRPAPAGEQRWLRHERNAPWTCTCSPGYGAVRAAGGEPVITRRVVAIGTDPARGQAVRSEWVVRVRDVPRPPRIVSADPLPDRRVAVAPGGARTFRVEAVDGDGAAELTYQWLVGNDGGVAGSQPTWEYRRDGEPRKQGPREHASRDKQLVVCRVSNRHGRPFTQAVAWVVERVPSNEPPEIVAIEPHFRDTIVFERGKPVRLTAAAHDPDRDDVLHFRWQLDGTVIALSPTCTLAPPHDPRAAANAHRLRLTVTDICGDADHRTWTVLPPE